MVRSLEDAGLVTVTPSGTGRARHVTLTDAGRDLLTRIGGINRTGAALVALVVAAVLVGRRPRRERDASGPGLGLTAAIALVLGVIRGGGAVVLVPARWPSSWRPRAARVEARAARSASGGTGGRHMRSNSRRVTCSITPVL